MTVGELIRLLLVTLGSGARNGTLVELELAGDVHRATPLSVRYDPERRAVVVTAEES